MKMAIVLLAVPLIGLVFAAGCGEDDDKSPTRKRMEKEVDEAIEATREHLSEKRRGYLASAEERLDELKTRMERLEAKAKAEGGEAREMWERFKEKYDDEMAEARRKIEEGAEKSDSAWEELKTGLKAAGDDVEAAVDRAAEEFKE